jgi:hypothetical protein
MRAAAVKRWISLPENYAILEEAFNSTTNYGRLEAVDATVAGRNVVRFGIFLFFFFIIQLYLSSYLFLSFLLSIFASAACLAMQWA